MGRGWTEREVWAELVWRGLGRSVGELGRGKKRRGKWAGLGWVRFEGLSPLSSSILFLNSNQTNTIRIQIQI